MFLPAFQQTGQKRVVQRAIDGRYFFANRQCSQRADFPIANMRANQKPASLQILQMFKPDKFDPAGFGKLSDMRIFTQNPAQIAPHLFQSHSAVLRGQGGQGQRQIAFGPFMPWR